MFCLTIVYIHFVVKQKQVLASKQVLNEDVALSDVCYSGHWSVSFPSGLPSAQMPFGTQADEDEWTDDLILVDLGDSCPGYGYTVSALGPFSHSGYPACDTVMMTKTNK